MTEEKPKVATVCLGGCSGCHMSFLNVDEYLVDLLDMISLEASHMIIDEKEIPEVDIGIVEGTVTNEADVENAKKIREKADILVAWGDCACLGGIMTMRNFFDLEGLLEECFQDKADSDSKVPSADSIPELLDEAQPVNQVVDVDAYIPGCPPSEDVIKDGFEELLKGNLPKPEGEKLQYD